MPCDLIGQAILTGAAMISAALILCTRTWAHTRRTPTPNPDQEHTHD